MSAIETSRKLIERHFIANFSGAKILLDGHQGKIEPPCVLLFIRWGDGFQASFGAPGSNIARTVGRVTCRVFTEGGKGPVEANTIADQVIDVFRNAALRDDSVNIQFGVPAVTNINIDAPDYTLDVSAPFKTDEYGA